MKKTIYLSASIVMLLVLPLIHAFGLTTPFFGDTVNLFKGDKTVITFTLQSMKTEGDITVKIQLIDGEEIAQLLDKKETYSLPAGIQDFPINLGITIPENPQKNYTIRFSVTEVAEKDNKQVKIATGYEKIFYVAVENRDRPTEAKPKWSEELQFTLITIAIILIIYVIHWLVKKHREQPLEPYV